jgi:tetratricopeptide (TPR) repeat protein
LGCLIGLLYEKLGRFDEALDWAKRAAALDDPFKGGNFALPARMRGLRLQGRCLAAKGQKSEAEAALTSAAEQLATIGYYLAEVLALRDLFVHVLKATDREDEGLMRLKVAVVRLVGVDATSEQLDVLATSLGDGVELAAVLEHGL